LGGTLTNQQRGKERCAGKAEQVKGKLDFAGCFHCFSEKCSRMSARRALMTLARNTNARAMRDRVY
jgi:hypothetical protein